MSIELELYKLITKGGYECGWVSETEFFVWLRFSELETFMEGILYIFGSWMFEDCGVPITLLSESVCIDLTTLLNGSDVNVSNVFPKDEFQH